MKFDGPNPNFGAPVDDGGFYDWIESKICPGCKRLVDNCCPFEGEEGERCPEVILALKERGCA